MKELGSELREVIREFKPQGMAVEQMFSHGDHVKTAILMAHAAGRCCSPRRRRACRSSNYTPTQVKRLLTGQREGDEGADAAGDHARAGAERGAGAERRGGCVCDCAVPAAQPADGDWRRRELGMEAPRQMISGLTRRSP